MPNNRSILFRLTLWMIFILAFGALLILGRDFLYPLAIAALFSFLLFPLANWMEKKGMPRILVNLICILVSIFLLIMLVNFISQRMFQFMDNMPGMHEQAAKSLDKLQLTIESRLNIHGRDNWLRHRVFGFLTASGDFISKAVAVTAYTIVKVALIPVYVFFFLYYRDKIKVFICRLLPPEKEEKIGVIISEISVVMRRYMAGIVTVVAILCILNSLGLYFIGMDYAILFGVLSALLNLIPYFGTLIGGIIPLLYALLIKGSPHMALTIVVLYLIIQFLDHNLLTPNITGGYVRVNPFAAILSIILGSMVWGLPGMIVAVPAAAVFKILSENIDSMKAFGFLFSTRGTTKHAVTWAKLKSFYGRLFKSKRKS